jgi:hypothetical protein
MKNIGLLAAAMLLVTAGSWAQAQARDHGSAAQAATRSTCPAAASKRGAPVRAAACLGAHGSAAAAGDCGAVSSQIVAAGAGSTAPRGVVKVSALRGAAGAETCEACADWTACAGQLQAAGAGTQVVPLKNGVMCVYTADTPRKAHAIQVLMARRHDFLATLAGAGDKAHLCAYCREMRGAVASGKLVREVINIDGGCIVMTTSPDPIVVSRIRAEAGVPIPGRVKS